MIELILNVIIFSFVISLICGFWRIHTEDWFRDIPIQIGNKTYITNAKYGDQRFAYYFTKMIKIVENISITIFCVSVFIYISMVFLPKGWVQPLAYEDFRLWLL